MPSNPSWRACFSDPVVVISRRPAFGWLERVAVVERKGVAERPDALLVVGRTHPRAMVPATASHSQKVISLSR